MLLSRETDIKLCPIYTKIYIYKILCKNRKFKPQIELLRVSMGFSLYPLSFFLYSPYKLASMSFIFYTVIFYIKELYSISFILIYRSLNCAERNGICSPVNPGLILFDGLQRMSVPSGIYIKNGFCGDTEDCFCWIWSIYGYPAAAAANPEST